MKNMNREIVLAFVAALMVAPVALSQSVEITPYVGYQFGGDFENRGDFFDRDDFFSENLQLDEGENYGLIVDIPINTHFQIEFLFSNQETKFELQDPFRGVAFDQDVDVQYYQAGVLWQFRSDSFRPFVAGGIGATDFDFGNGAGETRFSASFGGGINPMVNDHVGFRFEGRAYTTLVDKDDDSFCRSDYCFGYRDDTYMQQWDLKFGITFAF